MSATCPYCRDSLSGSTHTCSRCSSTLHADCWADHGGCTTIGCVKVRWRHLTDEDKARLRELGELNGCGPKGGWIKPPDFIFEGGCDHHDFNYWLGGDEADRLKADWEFLQANLQAADEHGDWWNRWWYRSLAWTYYWAVRRFGGSSFNYGRQRTRADLDETLRGVE